MDDVKCSLEEAGVSHICPDDSECHRCGWNPQEAAFRKRKIQKLGLEKQINGLYGIVVRK